MIQRVGSAAGCPVLPLGIRLCVFGSHHGEALGHLWPVHSTRGRWTLAGLQNAWGATAPVLPGEIPRLTQLRQPFTARPKFPWVVR